MAGEDILAACVLAVILLWGVGTGAFLHYDLRRFWRDAGRKRSSTTDPFFRSGGWGA